MLVEQDVIHQLPHGDTRQHDYTLDCWCRPTPNVLTVHGARRFEGHHHAGDAERRAWIADHPDAGPWARADVSP